MLHALRQDRLRERDEGLQAVDVHHCPSTVVPGDPRLDRAAALGQLLQHVPRRLAPRPVHGEHRLALAVGCVEDVHQDALADAELLCRLGRDAAHLALRHHPLRLMADRYQDAILVDPHDLPFNYLAAAQLTKWS